MPKPCSLLVLPTLVIMVYEKLARLAGTFRTSGSRFNMNQLRKWPPGFLGAAHMGLPPVETHPNEFDMDNEALPPGT